MEVHTFIEALSTSKIVELYNKYNPEKPVKKFSDRATAEKRLSALCTEKGINSLEELTGVKIEAPKQSADSINEEKLKANQDEALRAEAAKQVTKIAARFKTNTKVDKPKKEKGWLPGPQSRFEGKTFHKLIEVNPRRENTIGWGSWNRLKDGMSYKEYLSAGGRRVDLDWDIKHGYVEVKDAIIKQPAAQTA